MRNVYDPQLNPLVNGVVAGTAGAFGRTVVAPLCVTKIYGEVQCPGGRSGPRWAFYWIRRENGLLGYYRGNLVAASRLFLYTGIQFPVYYALANKWVRQKSGVPTFESLFAHYCAGAVSGAVATAVTHPLDVVKTRMALNPMDPAAAHYRSAQDAFLKILDQEGIQRGLYRGFGMSLVGSCVFSGTMFALWDFANRMPWMINRKPLLVQEWFTGPVIAVAAAYVVSHPFDVLRKKMMAQSYALPRNGGVDLHFSNYSQLISENFRWNGYYGFLGGLIANVLKAAPQIAAFWAMFAVLRSAAKFGRPRSSSHGATA